MSSSNESSVGNARPINRHGGGQGSGGLWSGANIAAMVLGFILFPPLGFVVLVWALMGRPIQEMPGWLREQWSRFAPGGKPRVSAGTDNSVFNEYQQTQYDRIREIKDEIRQRAEAFSAFRADARRRRDQKEFDDFMATSPGDR
jgi:hypothetical protein